ncbi:enoyl-CoA hydratase [Gordonia bronchialis]|uniref:hypothetical protein n=1 Tax=Gordonia bronchialis TaxID=2054 RepID=UPI000E031075|nr:hypothetical protein [Gordonia bronchialis]MCC3324918.1 hypothetical protein [Gordonia bronchialis]STQ65049.1 enoyl-CoA hydratase [Gordonia bronchialis]
MKANTDHFFSLWRSAKPTVAKVHGYAVAGGSDIAAASAHGNRSSTHRKCKICPDEPQQDVPINLAKPSNRSGLNAVFNEIGKRAIETKPVELYPMYAGVLRAISTVSPRLADRLVSAAGI